MANHSISEAANAIHALINQSPARYAADSPFLGALPLGPTFAHALGTNVLARAIAQPADR